VEQNTSYNKEGYVMKDLKEIIIDATEEEAEKLALEGNVIILGGVEVHVRFVRHNGDPGIQVAWTPPFGPDGGPDWIRDVNQMFADLCKETVTNMQNRQRDRLLRLVRKDGAEGDCDADRPEPGMMHRFPFFNFFLKTKRAAKKIYFSSPSPFQ
jgi:hypothetical protein